jgi:hypothetical protein
MLADDRKRWKGVR